MNSPPLPVPIAGVTLLLTTTPAIPDFVGAAPGMIAGVTQVNVRLPATIPAGGNPITIRVNGAPANVYVSE